MLNKILAVLISQNAISQTLSIFAEFAASDIF